MPKPGSQKIRTRSAATKRAASSEPMVRMIAAPTRQWRQPRTWRYRVPVPDYEPLPKARVLLSEGLRLLWTHKKLILGILFLYGLLNVLLVRGMSASTDISTIKALLSGDTQGAAAQFQSSSATFLYLLGTSGNATTGVTGLYQSVLLLLGSLAIIWSLRQAIAGNPVSVRDSFYQGMYPLLPYVLTCFLLGIQLLPLVVAAFLYNALITGGVAVHIWEQIPCIALCVLIAWWSLRMITATIFATYIVTLPHMTPMRAYRSARKLVYGRRLLIWRKLIFLPFILGLAVVLIEIPIIMFLTPLAAWTFFILSLVALPVVHSYLYCLYRKML